MTSDLRALLLGIGVLAGASAIARAQEPPPVPRTAEALRVFLDCRTTYCDFDYVRTEIAFVNYVRDPVDAQIFVLVTTEYTGGGGTQFTVNLIGRQDFTGRNDTLFYVSQRTDTYDEVRRGLTQTLKLGLVRYAARSVLAGRIQITYEAPPGQPAGDRQRLDPWDYWVFNTGMSGNFSGEQSRTTTSLYGSASANRTTEKWKLSFGLSAQYSRTVQTISGDTTVATDTHSESFGSLTVRSLGEHWAAGLRTSVSASTYYNQTIDVRLLPAIEYNVFPYSQATRHTLTIQYAVGMEAVRYTQETIYQRTSQWLPLHTLRALYNTSQPWGAANAAVQSSQYLSDPTKMSLGLSGNLDFRVFRGLSLAFHASVSFIHDQLYLPLVGATTEEVLLNLRQLATSYSYYTAVGFSYTFGSIYNNVVNPRFQ
ncbi:MAG TPA: hypothetical protein VMT21_05900 [Gemmatimonadales bacterium]|nr:hypothetical protein [Gemmatimonadales bacterium]